MTKSMTGFGRGEASAPPVRFEVDVRGVNHRFLEIRFRLPQEVSQMEGELRREVSAVVQRGRIDVTVSRIPSRDPETSVILNREVIARYLEAASVISKDYHLAGELGLESVLTLPGAVRFEVRKEGMEEERGVLVEALSRALAAFDGTRTAEGLGLGSDIRERIGLVEAELERIAEAAGAMPSEYLAKLRRRLAELLEGVPLDEARLMQEAAFLAGRSDVTEEIVRLRAHLRQALDCLDSRGAPVGKSLDFLVQEMHREVNTIGSKAEDLRVSHAVLRIKAEVEKIREQVQNLE
jgi:uncharacterized protein (TIGR00255 family)